MARSSETRHWTASNRLLWPVLEVLRARGLAPAEILRGSGVDEDSAYAPESRVPIDALLKVWRVAVQRTGDEALGVRLAGVVDPSARASWPMPLSLLEHVGVVSSTLAEAVETQARFARLLRDGVRAHLDFEGERICYRMELEQDEPPALVEHMFAVSLSIARRVRSDLSPTEVWFAHREPANKRPFHRFFRTENIRWNAPFSALFGDAAQFREPLPSANPAFRERLVKQAEQLVSDLPSVEVFEDAVCARIASQLAGGNTNSSAVAEKLGVSGRTLHRRLAEEGTTYQQLLDRVRLRTATRHLAAGKPIAEVAALVGFSQASTFHRAFKGWTGETPNEYQQRCRGTLTGDAETTTPEAAAPATAEPEAVEPPSKPERRAHETA